MPSAIRRIIINKRFIFLFILSILAADGSCFAASQPQDTTYPFNDPNCNLREVGNVTFMQNQRGRLDWSPTTNLIAFDKRGEDEFYDVYMMQPDGSDVKCLTCGHPDLPQKNIGQPAWHPSGRYLVFQVAKEEAQIRTPLGLLATNPGAGVFNELWIMDMSDFTVTQLTQLPLDSNYGTLHPHFSHDGNKLSWSQMYRKANFFKHEGVTGYWKLHVADFSAVGDMPRLHNEKIYEPGRPGMFENHGFSPDNQKIVFQSNMQSNKKKGETDLYQYHLETSRLEKLTETYFNEHGIYSPDGGKIAYMSSMGNKNKGTDWWLMNPDGSCKQRLTFFNQPGHPQYKDRKITSADLSWSPSGDRFLGYFHDMAVKNKFRGKMQGEGHVMVELPF